MTFDTPGAPALAWYEGLVEKFAIIIVTILWAVLICCLVILLYFATNPCTLIPLDGSWANYLASKGCKGATTVMDPTKAIGVFIGLFGG